MRNLALDRVRSRRRASYASDAAEIGSGAERPDERLIRNEASQHIRCALGELPYEQREVVILHLQGEMTFRQIAKLQDVSVNTAQGRYRYGLDKLRARLDSEMAT